MNVELAKIIGKSLLYSGIISSLGSVEMSSKFSVLNFAKDQATLQGACDALESFIIIAAMWIVGSALLMYASYGMTGLTVSLISSFIMTAWIVVTYIKAFRTCAKKYNLKTPVLFGIQL